MPDFERIMRLSTFNKSVAFQPPHEHTTCLQIQEDLNPLIIPTTTHPKPLKETTPQSSSPHQAT